MSPGHSRAHGHSHGGHGHSHAPARFTTAFRIGVLLNAAFVLVEVAMGFAAHSLALVADAGHNLSDVLGLLLAWGAAEMARKRPTVRHTYGMRRSTVLAALANALLLLVAVGAIGLEAIQRVMSPHPVAGGIVAVVAGAGVIVNGLTAALFFSGRREDLNVRGAFLHMAADAAVSAAVLLAGIAILRGGPAWLDPVVSLVVAAVILWGTWGLLRESLALAMDAVPVGIDPEKVRDYLTSLPGVTAVHDLHIWGMSTTEVALTAHLVCPEGWSDETLVRTRDELHARFAIEHTTLQIERGDAGPCAQESEQVV